jgi:hypothetical protein
MSQCLTGKTIGELSTLSGLSGNTLFIVEQDGITYHIPFSAFGINANSCITETLTYAQMTGKTSTNSLKPGCFYMITDADPTLYGGTNIIIQAFSTNELVLQGHGIFYTPPYDQNVSGFGIWTTVGTYSAGTKVIWGGYVWENLTGSVGTSTDIYNLDNTNWSAKTYNPVDYNVSVDIIHYDYDNNTIIYRKDRSNNEVSVSKNIIDDFVTNLGLHPIKSFQWGNPLDINSFGVSNNHIIDSLFECINFRGTFLYLNTLKNVSVIKNNTWDNNSSFQLNTLDYSGIFDNTLDNNSGIFYNILNDSSTIQFNNLDNDSQISNNTLDSGSGIYYNTLDDSAIVRNALDSGLISINNLDSSTITDNILTKGGAIGSLEIGSNQLIFSYIIFNVLQNGSYIGDNTLSGNSGSNCGYQYNTLMNLSGFFNNLTLSGSSYEYNTLMNESSFSGNIINNSRFEYNTLSDSSFRATPNFANQLVLKIISQIDIKNCDVFPNTGQSLEPDIYNLNCSKTIFKNLAGTPKLSYYNASDTQIIKNVII